MFVVGVGMTKFEKPGSRDWDYPDMAKESGTNALADAGIDYAAVEQAAVGYCYGDSTAGQRAIYGLGLCALFAANLIASVLVQGELAEADPFSTEHPFLSPRWPRG